MALLRPFLLSHQVEKSPPTSNWMWFVRGKTRYLVANQDPASCVNADGSRADKDVFLNHGERSKVPRVTLLLPSAKPVALNDLAQNCVFGSIHLVLSYLSFCRDCIDTLSTQLGHSLLVYLCSRGSRHHLFAVGLARKWGNPAKGGILTERFTLSYAMWLDRFTISRLHPAHLSVL